MGIKCQRWGRKDERGLVGAQHTRVVVRGAGGAFEVASLTMTMDFCEGVIFESAI